ncbi:hypothetical protein BU16DRAFT_565098 [Lophium mytilinum]|uniref:Uncharacterized protein n=1 Tax=Lophium mytilinum TaxID=390894 RepID=A0A6A6QH60_9PEZI|nr:hypothetical protein BU16DRAFT_565098 [Lophium mytilinum]
MRFSTIILPVSAVLGLATAQSCSGGTEPTYSDCVAASNLIDTSSTYEAGAVVSYGGCAATVEDSSLGGKEFQVLAVSIISACGTSGSAQSGDSVVSVAPAGAKIRRDLDDVKNIGDKLNGGDKRAVRSAKFRA